MTETTERLTAQQLEGRLRAALATITALWPTMIQPPSATSRPRTHGTGALLPDTDERDTDMHHLEKILEARRDVTLTLRSWCQVTVEDHDVIHGIPGGGDVPGMAAFLTRWSYLLAEHEAARDLLEEVAAAQRKVEQYAPPAQERPLDWSPRPRTMKLGACPLTWQDPGSGDDRPCPGTLKGDEDGWVRCDTCGTAAVMGWWEQQVHGTEGMAPMTLDGVRAYLHREHGLRLTRRGLQSWVDRGHLVASGANGSAALYDVGAVEAAVTRRQRTARAVQ